jgi:hypothetical protein
MGNWGILGVGQYVLYFQRSTYYRSTYCTFSAVRTLIGVSSPHPNLVLGQINRKDRNMGFRCI